MTTIEKIADAVQAASIMGMRRRFSREYAEAIAIAAVKAMREPSIGMVRAAHKHHEGEYFLPYSLWQSMIDSILTEAEGEGK